MQCFAAVSTSSGWTSQGIWWEALIPQSIAAATATAWNTKYNSKHYVAASMV
jgi:hypothetical protein